MIKKLKKSDYLFIAALLAGLMLHILYLYYPNPYEDETFYPSIPLRLINDDSLIQHEWHLTQFSSLFLYLPVRIWLALKGSTDGIILFLRCLYLTIHLLTSVGIYTYFRKYGVWAVAAAIMFLTEMPYRIMAISYNSMFVLFLLFFIFFLLLIYQKNSPYLYASAGICFGACCVSNPFFCTAYVLYIVSCILWSKKFFLQRKFSDIKSRIIEKSSKQRKNNRKKSDKKAIKKADKKKAKKDSYINSYDCFFNKKAIIFFSCGISAIALISIVYFFATGGTISSIFDNVDNLLANSGYSIFSSSLAIKLKTTVKLFRKMSFNMPFLLPSLYIALIFDKKRKEYAHRTVYVILSLLIAIFYFLGVTYNSFNDHRVFALSLPFTVISSVCYILTKNKNKKLFYCTWYPCAIGAITHYIASNTHLSSIFMVLAISNITGVFLVRDLFEELSTDLKAKKKSSKKTNSKRWNTVCQIVICIGLCSQLLFQICAYQLDRIPKKDYNQVTTGPYANFYMKEQHYDNYVKSINDLDIIKERSEENDPVLIVSSHNWMYLYIDRPFAIHTTWQEKFNPESLTSYYKQNTDKKPKYIYIGFVNYYYNDMHVEAQEIATKLNSIFICTQEELSNGILLTVNE